MEKRIYYKFDIVLCSPLSLSSGLNDNTDNDVLFDSRGKPYIPATSLAGVLFHDIDKNEKKKYCGTIENGENKSSQVVVYDSEITEERNITVRDSVALEDKVGVDGAKFDFEIVETGAAFTGYMELTKNSVEATDLFELQLAKLNNGTLRLGRKTTRGYGRVKLERVMKKTFDDADKWLDFDMFDETCWDNSESVELTDSNDEKLHIRLSLEMNGATSIRSYTTELPQGQNDTAPDYKSLSLLNGTPVIPGTSWAGAFRDRFKDFSDVEQTKKYFGYSVTNNNITKCTKSKVTFSESQIINETPKLITRNSIDRFSGGTNDKSLYSELTVFNGKTKLDIDIPKDMDSQAKSALCAVIADLDNGFLAVGGLTAVGRGLFEVQKFEVDGTDKTEQFKAFNFENVLEEAE